MSVPAPPSPEAARLAARTALGRLEHTFPPRKEVAVREDHRGLFVAASVTAVACLAAGGVVLWLLVSWVLALYPLFIAVMAVGALLNSPNARKKLGGRRLHLFEEGLLVDMGPGRMFAVRWDEAVHYQETIQEVIAYKGTQTPLRSAHTSTLVAPDGARTRITDFFADHGTWAPLISEAIARAQGGRAWAAVRAGRRIGHGPFTLGAAGISTRRRGVLPWSAVETIGVRAGFVVVREHGRRKPWAHARVRAVPNLLVFLTVAACLHRG
ncbi:DUF6585 family protein [Streptomyces lavendulocolor]|uniref:DUF6585 family protein n=1 Tax=Streptomyces lavendulocolor TaxID=67316 RepID=UPI003C2E9DF8